MKFLGKLPARPGAVRWHYRDVFKRTALKLPPAVFGHIWNQTKIDMLGNDQCGDCVWATQAHLLQAMQRGVGKPQTQFTAESVIGDYSAFTGYDPHEPNSDTGTNMADAASYWRRTGITDGSGAKHTIDAYVSITFEDTDELLQAAYDFGGVGLGLNLPQSAIDQFDRHIPWRNSFINGKAAGGHAVALLGRNSRGHAIIATWDGITAANMSFIKKYADEALAFLSLEYLDAKGLNPRGYDRTELTKRLSTLR
jgi:hypothetical protein